MSSTTSGSRVSRRERKPSQAAVERRLWEEGLRLDQELRLKEAAEAAAAATSSGSTASNYKLSHTVVPSVRTVVASKIDVSAVRRKRKSNNANNRCNKHKQLSKSSSSSTVKSRSIVKAAQKNKSVVKAVAGRKNRMSTKKTATVVAVATTAAASVTEETTAAASSTAVATEAEIVDDVLFYQYDAGAAVVAGAPLPRSQMCDWYNKKNIAAEIVAGAKRGGEGGVAESRAKKRKAKKRLRKIKKSPLCDTHTLRDVVLRIRKLSSSESSIELSPASREKLVELRDHILPSAERSCGDTARKRRERYMHRLLIFCGEDLSYTEASVLTKLTMAQDDNYALSLVRLMLTVDSKHGAFEWCRRLEKRVLAKVLSFTSSFVAEYSNRHNKSRPKPGNLPKPSAPAVGPATSVFANQKSEVAVTISSRSGRNRVSRTSSASATSSTNNSGEGGNRAKAGSIAVNTTTVSTPTVAAVRLDSSTHQEASSVAKRWSGRRVERLLLNLEERRTQLKETGANLSLHSAAAARAGSNIDGGNSTGDVEQEEERVKIFYALARRRMDVTCGADGRYGMTGHVNNASLSRLFEVLKEECSLDSTSRFFDIGHGMGRPSMHAALLQPPPLEASGTEFNPSLYAQSMLLLRDAVRKFPQTLAVHPRVFFFDANVLDFTSLEPYTHVYAFNVGMPEAVVAHILSLAGRSNTIEWLIMYLHGPLTQARIEAVVGKVVCTLPMTMPGGSVFRAAVVKIKKKTLPSRGGRSCSGGGGSSGSSGSSSTTGDNRGAGPDEEVAGAARILSDPELYRLYLDELGLSDDLEHERMASMMTRHKRADKREIMYLSSSPDVAQISLGLLRRVALRLGVGPAGDRARLLLNIREYVPRPFRISLFPKGDEYEQSDVEAILDELLSQPPARRQPEMVF